MAQTTAGISWRNNKLEISTNGSVWTDISGFSNNVSIDGGDRAVSEFFTNDGDTPIITTGKRAGITVRAKVVYTETGGDAAELARTSYENNSPLYLRWSPKGGNSGNAQFTTSPGVALLPTLPVGAADSADLVAIELGIRVGSITRSIVA